MLRYRGPASLRNQAQRAFTDFISLRRYPDRRHFCCARPLTLEEQKGTKRYKRVQDFSGDLAARGKRRRRTRAWRSDVSTEKGDQVGFSTLTFGLPVIPPEQQMARRPSRQEFVFYAALV